MGVHSPGSDIDTLCVGPRHVQREDFFGSFQEILRADPEVTKFSAVPDAFVPIMKFLYSGVDVRVICCKPKTELSNIFNVHCCCCVGGGIAGVRLILRMLA